MDGFGDTAIRPDLRPTVGLVLTGGGARSAYQVGVLRALAELLPRARNPFQIIVGTSAGAVAAGVLAAEAHHWRRAVAGLEQVWANFRSSQVFHVNARHMMRAGAHWVLALVSGGLVLSPPRSMLDNTPLRSEEHTSELQSPCNLVCRLLLEKKKIKCSRTPHVSR